MEKKTQAPENPPDEVLKTQKRICSWAMTSAIVVALVFIILDEKAIAKGLILGTLFSIINFVLLGKAIPIMIGQRLSKARILGLISILCRYGVLAIPLILGIEFDAFNFVAVVVGIFSVQVVTLVDYAVVQRMIDRK